MKVLIVLALVGVISATPIEPRWNVSPDGEGKMHLIDTNPINEPIEPIFNPETDTRFMLHTRLNPTSGQQITWTTQSIQNSNFNPAWPVRVLIHGWNSGLSSGMNTAPTASYLQLGNFNVIQVDWSIGANTINYITARNRVGLVADQISRLLNFLVTSGSIANMNRVSIAGHSLGAHIAGLTGKRVRAAGRVVQVIFGLDPAGPLFSLNEPNERLDANDAVYTEGVRTNVGGSGFLEPFCHSDFYPNGGDNQPGCGVDASGSCSHSRAHALFAETIISNRFVSQRCATLQQALNQACTGARDVSMGGEPGNIGLRGILHLRTNGNSPFAQGDDQPGCPIDAAGSCSHSRAHELFAESIISDQFLSQSCNTLNQAINQNCLGPRETPMGGEPGNIGLRGIYSLRTNRNSPFAQGDRQPGCGIDLTGSCSHSRAHSLFAESITSTRFIAQHCDTLQQARNQACIGESQISMGGDPGNVGLTGIFHLRTNSNSPYAMG